MSHITFNTSIDTLLKQQLITMRAYNCLYTAGLYTLGDVQKFLLQGNDLMRLPKFGRKSADGIKNILSMCDMEPVEEKSEQPFDRLEDPLKEIITQAFGRETASSETVLESLKGYLAAKYPDVRAWFNGAASRGVQEVMDIQPSVSLKENIAYRKWHLDLLGSVIKLLEDQGMMEMELYDLFSSVYKEAKKSYLEFKVYDIIKHFLGPETDEILAECYETLCNEHLSAWGMGFKKDFLPSYRDVIPYLDKPLAEFWKICPGRGKNKSVTEVYNMVKKFSDLNVIPFGSYEKEPQTLHEKTKKDYPYLNEEEIDFVIKYIQYGGIRPVFFLLYKMILTSTRKECKYFGLHYGFADGIAKEYKEIGTQFNLSGERIRQMVSNHQTILNNFPISSEEINHYKALLWANVITECSPEYIDIIAKENLPKDFTVFASLCTLICDHEICDVLGYKVLMRPALRSQIKYKPLIEKFDKTFKKGCLEDTLFPFSYFTGDIPREFNPDIKALLTFLARDKENVSVGDGEVLIGKNKIALDKELEKILDRAGEPLSLEELFDRFKSLYPGHKFSNPTQIQRYIKISQRIRPLGNQGRYGLEGWDGVFFGSIRDMALDILGKRDAPVHISDLFEKIKRNCPSTNIKSLYYSLAYDDNKRFIVFEDSYFGLATREYDPPYLAYERMRPVARYNFEQRIQMFRQFVQTNHRFPFFNGAEEEASLMRWLYNVTHDNIDITTEQMTQIDSMMEEYAKACYPTTVTEHTFLQNCQQYKQFVAQNHTLSSSNNGSELYYWFRRSKEGFPSFQDQRREYFKDLCDYLRSEGFDVNINP